MKIALVTNRPAIADKKTNLAFIKKTIETHKASVYVFGELQVTGYALHDEIRDHAETISGPSIQQLKTIAKKHNCYITTGLPLYDENVNGLIYNSAVFIHPNEHVNVYHKWFLPTLGPFKEKLFYDEGEQLQVISTPFATIGLAICYDIYFPEIFRTYTMLGADLIICISASPNITRKYFETLIPARAIENTVFFAYVNLVGTQENLVFWGGSQLYDPLGSLLVKAPYFKESVITYDIDFSKIKQARAARPVLRDVRPEIFYDLWEISRHHSYKKNKKKTG